MHIRDAVLGLSRTAINLGFGVLWRETLITSSHLLSVGGKCIFAAAANVGYVEPPSVRISRQQSFCGCFLGPICQGPGQCQQSGVSIHLTIAYETMAFNYFNESLSPGPPSAGQLVNTIRHPPQANNKFGASTWVLQTDP